MKQTKKQSAIESFVNIIVGLITSFLIQLWIYPLLDIPVSFNQNLIITLVFFIASFIRGYLIRRFFNHKHSK
jgi:membrane protein YdbS with pleckstrin-like domain